MIAIPAQNVRIQHWIVNSDKPFTPGLTYNLQLVNTRLDVLNGYMVLSYYYEIVKP